MESSRRMMMDYVRGRRRDRRSDLGQQSVDPAAVSSSTDRDSPSSARLGCAHGCDDR